MNVFQVKGEEKKWCWKTWSYFCETGINTFLLLQTTYKSKTNEMPNTNLAKPMYGISTQLWPVPDVWIHMNHLQIYEQQKHFLLIYSQKHTGGIGPDIVYSLPVCDLWLIVSWLTAQRLSRSADSTYLHPQLSAADPETCGLPLHYICMAAYGFHLAFNTEPGAARMNRRSLEK